MKSMLLIATVLVAGLAQAADRKLGNVIVIERDIENVYQLCVDNMNSQTPPRKGGTQFCALQITKSPTEVMLNRNGGMRFRQGTCTVDSDFGNGKMLITMTSSKKDATAEDAKRCLQTALAENTDMVATIQTIE